MKRFDVYVIIALLAAAALGYGVFLAAGGGGSRDIGTAEIYVGGELMNTLERPLAGEYFHIDTEYGYNVILIDSEGVKMTEADCPSQDCVHSAKITRPGQMIVCLPHKVSVRLAGARTSNTDGSGVDAIAG